MSKVFYVMLRVIFYIIVWPIHGLLLGMLEWACAIAEITWSAMKSYAGHMRIGFELMVHRNKDAG